MACANSRKGKWKIRDAIRKIHRFTPGDFRGLENIREELPMSRAPALLTSAGRMPERSQHRVSEGQDGRSERPATGHGQP